MHSKNVVKEEAMAEKEKASKEHENKWQAKKLAKAKEAAGKLQDATAKAAAQAERKACVYDGVHQGGCRCVPRVR